MPGVADRVSPTGGASGEASRQPDIAAKGPPRRRGRVVLFRLLAVLLGVLPLVLAELLFVALDWGRPSRHDDPFMGFSTVHPLFVLSEDRSRYEIARSRWRCFCPESFAARKAPGEVRIFCLGGSTVQGRPFAIETSFTTWLEMYLRLADPNQTWQVVNCGGVSYASYRLVPILAEVLRYEPDVVVLYTGHNEFLEDREYGHLRDRPRFIAAPWELVARTRTYNLLREGYLRAWGTAAPDEPAGRPVLPANVDAVLEYEGGLDKYHRDEKRRRDVIAHFSFNLGRMVAMCRDAGVGVVLVDPPCNLRDCPPFKSQHRDGLTAGQLRLWKTLCRKASDHVGSDSKRGIELLRQALAIDDRHAGLHYRLAKRLDAAGNAAEAYRAYLRAKELDVCPLRILEPMNEAILETARRSSTPVIDVRKLVERRSPRGIPGGFLLLDHVHPSITGHRLIADALTDELARQGIAHPTPGWRRRQEQVVRKHLASLGLFYYAKGLQRLEVLRGWAAGRATDKPKQADGPR